MFATSRIIQSVQADNKQPITNNAMWAHLIAAMLGVWLMAAPDVLAYGLRAAASNNDHIVGPLIVTIGLVAATEATRNVRWANIPLGAWLLLAPWVLGYDNNQALLNDMGVGVAVLLLSLVEGKRKHRFGGGWRSLLNKYPLHQQEARIYEPNNRQSNTQ